MASFVGGGVDVMGSIRERGCGFKFKGNKTNKKSVHSLNLSDGKYFQKDVCLIHYEKTGDIEFKQRNRILKESKYDGKYWKNSYNTFT